MPFREKQKELSFIKKNIILANIIKAMTNRSNFLMLGHQSPDEDCIASIVAFSLLLSKFNKSITIYLEKEVHEHYQYLLDICKYNSIRVFYSGFTEKLACDTIVICDTANESMIEMNETIRSIYSDPSILKIEFDHHVGGDSSYNGDPGYTYVMEATSASELVGHLAFRLTKKKRLLKKYEITNIFSRNIILSILTGIVGDTKKGMFIKSSREQRYYNLFSNMYNSLLKKETTKKTNLSDIDDVFNELKRLSTKEKKCFDYIMGKKQLSNSIGYVVLYPKDIKHIISITDHEHLVLAARNVADALAEESQKLSLVVYCEDPAISDLVEFRVRRSQNFKAFDARKILTISNIKNGGGHEGAIGFRLPQKQIKNINKYVSDLIKKIEKEIA